MLTRLVRLLCLLAPLFLAPPAFAAEPGLALDPAVGLNAYVALADQEFADVRDKLRILAASENARSDDWNRIAGPLTILAKGVPARAAAWFVRPDGSYYAVDSGLTGQNLGSRGYFPKLMAGEEVTGDLVVSKSTGKRSAIIAVPVRREGRVIGALGVSMAMEKVAAGLDDALGLPPQAMFYALDSHGQVALHREPGLLFEFAAQLGSPTLAAAVRQMLATPKGEVRYEFQGAQRTAIYKRSRVTGWVYALRW